MKGCLKKIGCKKKTAVIVLYVRLKDVYCDVRKMRTTEATHRSSKSLLLAFKKKKENLFAAFRIRHSTPL